jgi:nucleoid DNA-binding protein
VLGVGFAFAGLAAKPNARAMLTKPVNKVLKILFTIFLENLWQQDLVALPNFSRLEIWGEQNVRVAHHFQATQAKKRLAPQRKPAVFR